MSLPAMVQVLACRRAKVRHAPEGIQVTGSVRHTVGKRYPGYGVGMDPGFHLGDANAGMMEWGESRF